MQKYPKIQTVFKRNPETNFKTLLFGDFSTSELEYLQNNEWIFTEKVDGTNIRIMWNGNTIKFGGKTDNAQIPPFLNDKLNQLFSNDKFGKIFDPGAEVCLYGEGYGAKIQKGGGKYNPTGVDFVLFDVLIDRWWLSRDNVIDIAEKFNIKSVPVVGTGTLTNMVNIVRAGLTSHWGDFPAEGIVARPLANLFNNNQDRIITKIKTKDFKGETKCKPQER